MERKKEGGKKEEERDKITLQFKKSETNPLQKIIITTDQIIEVVVHFAYR